MPASSPDRVERGARLVGAGILVSRLVGLVRNKVFTYYFGDSAEADAFTAASRIPNVVRNLLGEGTISASFVPVYAAALERGDSQGARALANALLGVLLAAVALLTGLGIALAPILTAIFAGDVAPDTAALITQLLRVMFPMTGVMVLSAWCLGVQNAHHRFFVAYASAAAWSVAQIALLVVGGPRSANLVQLAWWLSWATLAGAVLQVATQLPQVFRLMGAIRPTLDRAAPGLRETLANFVPVVGALGLFQISSLVDLRIASMLPEGAIALLSYANQVYLLPLSLFGVATAAAALPDLARRQARGESDAIADGVDRALQRVLFYTVPSAVAFVLLGDLMAHLLYGGGRFGVDQARTVHYILAGYAIGLSAYACSRVLTSTFHAARDYRTPLRAAAVAIVVSAGGALALALPFREQVNAAAGIAAGSAAGAFVNLTLLWRSASARGRVARTGAPRRVLWRALMASIVAGAAALGIRRVSMELDVQIAAIVVLAVFGVAYLAAASALGLDEAARLLKRLREIEGVTTESGATFAGKLDHLPDSPGVYLWKDADGAVLYVGKANNLRSRVRSYVGAGIAGNPRIQVMMRAAADIETIVVPSETAALVLESNLIKEHRPRFNVLLRDDKTYPFIKVTLQERFPRVFVTRRVVNDGARYFGPYTDVGAMRKSLTVVKRIFTVRSCRYALPGEAPERPCLDYFIQRCKAPCVGWQSEQDYRAMIDEVVAFLAGRTDEVVRRVRERMQDASANLDYERAAELRDSLVRLERMEEPTVVLDAMGGDRDAIGFARDGDDACVTLLRVRGGKLLAREQRFLENVLDVPDGDALSAYLAGSYLPMTERGAEVLLPVTPTDPDTLQAALGHTRMLVPQRGPRRELVNLAEQNARHLLEEFKLAADEADERAADPVYELGRELGLQRIPRSLVCFDISTAQGRDTVASVVWFENGRPRRAEYRTLRIKTVDGTDDFASMHEAVSRYFRRRVDESKPLPDLVVIDGGKGQLGAAAAALDTLGVAAPLVAIAKRDEDLYVRGNAEPLRLPRRSPALRLLQQARDEAHRSAVTYNRKRRTMRTVTSELLRIPGIGPTRRRALLTKFGSLQGVREASPETIAALPGFSIDRARSVLAALGASVPEEPEPTPNSSSPEHSSP